MLCDDQQNANGDPITVLFGCLVGRAKWTSRETRLCTLLTVACNQAMQAVDWAQSGITSKRTMISGFLQRPLVAGPDSSPEVTAKIIVYLNINVRYII